MNIPQITQSIGSHTEEKYLPAICSVKESATDERERGTQDEERIQQLCKQLCHACRLLIIVTLIFRGQCHFCTKS